MENESLNLQNLMAPHIKEVKYVEIDAIYVKEIIEDTIKQNVPEIKTFCPDGWTYNPYHFLNPIVDYFLGECRGNGVSYTQWKPELDEEEDGRVLYSHDDWTEEDSYSEPQPQKDFSLRVKIQEDYLVKGSFESKCVEIPIPFSLMNSINEAIFGDNEKVKMYWGWWQHQHQSQSSYRAKLNLFT